MTTAVRDLAVHRRASPFGMVSTATAGLDLFVELGDVARIIHQFFFPSPALVDLRILNKRVFVDLRALRQWRDIFERDGYKNHAATASDLLAWIDQDSRNYR
jgi:hypothetical protein|nr:MAG TPA: hypothetical protein [Caudoviricetes sp.]